MKEDGSANYSGHRFRAGLRAFVFGRVTQGLATALLLVVTIRVLGPREYGTYSLIWGLCELAAPLTSLGLLQAVQYFLPRLVSSSGVRQVRYFVRVMELARWSLMLIAGVVVAVFWVPLAAWLGIGETHARHGILIAALLVAVLGGRFTAELLESLLEQRDAQWVRAIQPIGRLCGIGVLWMMDLLSLAALLWVDLAVCAFALGLGQYFLVRQLRAMQPSGQQELDWREVRTFIAHISTSEVLTASGDVGALRLVLARVLGVEAVGVLAFLQQLLEVVKRYLPSVLLANVVRPMLVARHAAGELGMVGAGVAMLAKLNLIMLLGMLGVFWTGGDQLLSVLSGGAVDRAGVVMGVLVIGLLCTSQSLVTIIGLQVHRLPAKVALLSTLAPLTIVLAWWGASRGGLLGAALGVAVSMSLRGVFSIVLLQRSVGRAPLDWRSYARLVLLALVLVAFSGFVAKWSGALASAALFAALFFGTLLWRCPLNDAEVDLAARALGARAGWIRRWSQFR